MSSNEQSAAAKQGEIDPVQYLATLLKFAVGKEASDIHLRTRTHPVIRIDGVLQSMERFPATSPAFMKELSNKIIPGQPFMRKYSRGIENQARDEDICCDS